MSQIPEKNSLPKRQATQQSHCINLFRYFGDHSVTGTPKVLGLEAGLLPLISIAKSIAVVSAVLFFCLAREMQHLNLLPLLLAVTQHTVC